MNVLDIDPDAHDRGDIQKYWMAISPQDPPATFEVRHRRKDNSLYYAEVTVSKMEQLNNYCIVRDITDRKLAEDALRESEERFKALHNASFGGIVIHDKGLILECYQGLTEITGVGYDELIGMDDGLLLIA